jgi:hypothetical protein
MEQTPADRLPATPAQPATDPANFGEWQSFPPAAAQVAMITGTLRGLLFGLGPALFAGVPVLVKTAYFSLVGSVLLMIGAVLSAIVAGAWLGYRSWKFARWKLDDTGLHAKRGYVWRREILIPRSRVQHLDIERGPIERHFGLASLVVHTAGTRQHALRQSGFFDADAVALRDALVPASDRHDDVL